MVYQVRALVMSAVKGLSRAGGAGSFFAEIMLTVQ
mgnify:CR=1 FL=1